MRCKATTSIKEEGNEALQCVLEDSHLEAHRTVHGMLFVVPKKSPSDLISDEFIERMLEDIPRALPARTGVNFEAEAFSNRAAYRRMMREKILERLAQD